MLRAEVCHDSRPQETRGAQLGDLQIEVHPDPPEEGQASGEGVDIQTGGERGTHILLAIGQGEGEFQGLGGAGLLEVIAGDRDRVEPWHLLRCVGDDVGDDPHRGGGGIDIGITDHELLEDVVLDGPGEPVQGDPLLLGGDDIAGEDRQHRPVHRHRHRHPVERDALEQDLYVLDRIDRHPGLADITRDARLVRVEAPMRREIEGDRDPLPARGEGLAEEGVGLLGGRESRVLADGPGALGVHGRLGTADEGRQAGERVGMGEPGQVGGRVERLDRQALRGLPGETVDRFAVQGQFRGGLPGLIVGVVIGCHGGFPYGLWVVIRCLKIGRAQLI